MNSIIEPVSLDNDWQLRLDAGGVLGEEANLFGSSTAQTSIGRFGGAVVVKTYPGLGYGRIRQKLQQETVAEQFRLAIGCVLSEPGALRAASAYQRVRDRIDVLDSPVGNIFDAAKNVVVQFVVNTHDVSVGGMGFTPFEYKPQRFRTIGDAEGQLTFSTEVKSLRVETGTATATQTMILALESRLGLNPSRGERILKISRPTYYKWKAGTDIQPQAAKLNRLQQIHTLIQRSPELSLAPLLDLPGQSHQSLMQLLESDALDVALILRHINWLSSLDSEARAALLAEGTRTLSNVLKESRPLSPETIQAVTKSGQGQAKGPVRAK